MIAERFYLGAHETSWLHRVEVPLMVSHVRLVRPFPRGDVRTWKPATTPWVLDSGGFSQLQAHGRWTIDAPTYIAAVRRYRSEIGQLAWCAPQDWMVEPFMLAKTGLTIAEHQARTIDSFVELRDADLPVIPVLQGWEMDDYRRHVDDYARRGVDLIDEPTVGLGSVCRRQATDEIQALVEGLAPLSLHGFGVKTSGLSRYGKYLTSADSMAWSLAGRRTKVPCPVKGRGTCQDCMHYALAWRDRVLEVLT